MLPQELYRPMEFSHQPILVRGVSAHDVVHKITFKNRRKCKRSKYGIGMSAEIHFHKPDNAKITVETIDKNSLPLFKTKNTKLLSVNVDDF